MSNEEKWKANEQKVAYLQSFPGWLSSWEQGIGSTIEQVHPIPEHSPHSVLLLSHNQFAVAPPLHGEPQLLTAGLLTARPYLEPAHGKAFEEYDRLTRIDQEAGRVARLENILKAIDNNVDRIPELKTRIRDLVQQWEAEGNH